MPGRSVRLFVVVAAGMVVLLSVAAAIALASSSGASVSGEISRAEANEAWTTGSIAGSAQWADCPEAPYPGPGPEPEPFEEEEGEIIWDPPFWNCEWTPYATVGPGSDPAECGTKGRRLGQLAAGVTLAWKGETRTAPGSAAFDLADVPLDGTPGQLLCLSLFEEVPESAVCAFARTSEGAERESSALEEECPEYVMVPYHQVLDSAPLQAQESGSGGTPPTGGDPPPSGTASVGQPDIVAVPWEIRSIDGRRSITIAWGGHYCLTNASPQVADVVVRWRRHRPGRKFRAQITAYLSYPPGEYTRLGRCTDLADLTMSRRVSLRHPLAHDVLLDGAASPPKRRWPG